MSMGKIGGDWCKCPDRRPKPTKECGSTDVGTGYFLLSNASPSNSFADMEDNMNNTLEKTSPEICQHALVGTITPTEAKQVPWAEEASELSRHGSDADQDRGYGRMRPVKVKENATGPAGKALARVCKDECEGLLDMMKEKAGGA